MTTGASMELRRSPSDYTASDSLDGRTIGLAPLVTLACGINTLTSSRERGTIAHMSRDAKRRRLQECGLLHRHPEEVKDPLFQTFREFFDANDLLQVRYELLRAHRVDSDPVREVCERYGLTRQTFYNLLEKFARAGTVGLIPEKPGPQGPSKLTPEVVAFAREQLGSTISVSGAKLARRIRSRFGRRIHRRTVEKLMRELRSKKNS